MASRGSCIRSAARATSSEPDGRTCAALRGPRLGCFDPLAARVRLAGLGCADVRDPRGLRGRGRRRSPSTASARTSTTRCSRTPTPAHDPDAERAVRRSTGASTVAITPPLARLRRAPTAPRSGSSSSTGSVLGRTPVDAPSLGTPRSRSPTDRQHGYRVTGRQPRPCRVRRRAARRTSSLQYARHVAPTPRTRVSRRASCSCCSACSAAPCWRCWPVLAIARRAMSPIAELTAAAAEIARTRDPARAAPRARRRRRGRRAGAHAGGHARRAGRAPAPRPRRRSTRQREFVADASHELRTPLTSVLANLELLAEALRRRPGATRPARRCARPSGCAGWSATCCCSRAPTPPRRRSAQPLDLRPDRGRGRRRARAGQPTTTSSSLDASRRRRRAPRRPAPRRDQPDRERAAPHAAGHRRSSVAHRARAPDGRRELVVADDGPGHPARAGARTLFERFVRGGRRPRRLVRPRAWRSSLPSPSPTAAPSPSSVPARGARFDCHASPPLQRRRGAGRSAARCGPRGGIAAVEVTTALDERPTARSASQTSTTTGSTIGRRRSRS